MSLIGENNHQSVLDEDASLFQTQQEKSERQKWSELSRSQRLRYFKDYYLFKCLAVIVVVGFIGTTIWHFAKPQKEQKLSFAIVHNTMIPETKTAYEQMFTEMFVTDPDHEEVRIDDAFPDRYESDAKLTAYLSAQEIDLLVTNEEHFQMLAKNGCFENLNDLMPEFAKKHAESLYLTEGYAEESSSNRDNSIDPDHTENKAAYGIDITDCKLFQEQWFHSQHAILGIVQYCEQKENAIIALEKFFSD